MNILDYSQYDLFEDCELKWYERYAEQWQRRPREGQQDNALTLGGLVHTGLQALREKGVPEISEEAIARYNPTPECYLQAQQLVVGYAQAYPDEHWNKFYCEEPLRFPLCDHTEGLAKVDCYFHIDSPQVIQSGLGDTFVLTPGVWIFEYKTKAASKSIGNYVDSWKVNKQADFQLLALKHKLGEDVQGIFVNVLEKPAAYAPRRTCKGCRKQYELRDWAPTGDGFACPACAHVQQIDTSDKSKVERKATYYRLAVTRNDYELKMSLEEIEWVAHRMDYLRQSYAMAARRATRRCVDAIFGPCEYFSAHSNLLMAREQPSNFVLVEALAYLRT